MKRIEVRAMNTSGNGMPEYKTEQSAGMDLRACLTSPVTINPGERALIVTGMRISLPEGYEAQIRPRSGLALKHGVTVLNTPGTIDADYRDEIGVLLVNHGNEPFTVENGDRIAQMVISEYVHATMVKVEAFTDEHDRGGGWGHTGIK